MKQLELGEEGFNQIDLTEVRKKFFEQVKRFISDPERSDPLMMELVAQDKVDINVQCLTRDDLHLGRLGSDL